MVYLGPVAPMQPWDFWSATEWASFFDREQCPHAAGLWRMFAEVGTPLPLPVSLSLISPEWR